MSDTPKPAVHTFEPYGSGGGCFKCELPENNEIHARPAPFPGLADLTDADVLPTSACPRCGAEHEAAGPDGIRYACQTIIWNNGVGRVISEACKLRAAFSRGAQAQKRAILARLEELEYYSIDSDDINSVPELEYEDEHETNG